MQLTYDVRYLFTKPQQRPRTLDPMKIPFRLERQERIEPKQPPLTAEEATRRHRAAIIAASGGKFRVRLPDGTLVDGKGRLP